MDELPLIAEWQRVTHRLLDALDEALRDLGLSAGEVNALAGFGPTGERSVRELVELTAQRPSTLTGVLDRLERRGLVERRLNPGDRRSLLVVLTPAGRERADAVASALAALEARLGARAGGRGRGLLRAIDAALDRK